jgi:site-specific DNA-cytosine methylase
VSFAVFMDIAKFLKPRYVLMENVVDILKFGDGILGRYAIRRLVNMGYQVCSVLSISGSAVPLLPSNQVAREELVQLTVLRYRCAL